MTDQELLDKVYAQPWVPWYLTRFKGFLNDKGHLTEEQRDSCKEAIKVCKILKKAYKYSPNSSIVTGCIKSFQNSHHTTKFLTTYQIHALRKLLEHRPAKGEHIY